LIDLLLLFTTRTPTMQFLFVKDALAWPRSSGHDVHTFYLMQALARQGHGVHLATRTPVPSQAVDGGGLASCHVLTGVDHDRPLALSKLQEKFRGYWGVPVPIIREIGAHARAVGADVVVVVGLNVLPYLGAVEGAVRVWYAGDEWFWHHASQARIFRPSTWKELKQAALKGMYERSYAALMDRVWMVSEADRKALKWVAGHGGCDVLPNGIDADYFAPGEEPQKPASCVFWGRLDFGPNQQALAWFCDKVWPRVRAEKPDATFSIYGFQPTEFVRALAAAHPGVTLTPDQPDIRAEVRKHEVVVLPFVSGGGIKNKLLEAAALGKAIVCTPRTVSGLSAGDAVLRCERPAAFADRILELFAEPERRQTLGQLARDWVVNAHTWEAAAARALQGLQR
jgi:polysaccharide biosynthesis protein PslH